MPTSCQRPDGPPSNRDPLCPYRQYTLFNHFTPMLFEHSTNPAAATKSGNTMHSAVFIAAEFLPDSINFKTYIQPPTSAYEDLMTGIEADSPARSMVNDFLRNSDEGKLMTPFQVGVENKAGSRLKWYFKSPNTLRERAQYHDTWGLHKDTAYRAAAS